MVNNKRDNPQRILIDKYIDLSCFIGVPSKTSEHKKNVKILNERFIEIVKFVVMSLMAVIFCTLKYVFVGLCSS